MTASANQGDKAMTITVERVFRPADLPAWIHRLQEPDRGDVIDRARRDLAFRCECYDAHENTAMQGQLLRETRRLMDA